MTGWQVEMEESGVEFAAQEKAAFGVPAERWTVPADVASEVSKVVGRVCQLKDTRNDELQGCWMDVSTFKKCFRQQSRKLLDDEEAKICTTDS